MSETGVNKQSNSSCVTADSNFASGRTSEKFYHLVLLTLQSDPRTKDLFAAENGNAFKVTAMPIGLRDLGKINSKFTTRKDNYATDRADYEASDYAHQMCPLTNPAYSDFYNQKFFKAFKDSVVAKFSAISDRTIKVLSQISYASLSKGLVNILLKCKPDGTKNVVRRLKINPTTQVFDEEGKLISYEYFTQEEIDNTEREMYMSEGANHLKFLNLEHIPFVFSDFILSLASLMNVPRKGRSINTTKLSAFDIFPTDNIADPIMAECFDFFRSKAQNDLELIDHIESRNGGCYTIVDLIHKDYSESFNAKIQNFYENNLTMREIYVTLLIYLKYITILAVPLIKISRDLIGNEQRSDISKKIGIEDGDSDNFLIQVEDILTNIQVFDMLFNEEQILFTLPDYLARYLVYFVAKGFACRKKIVDKQNGNDKIVFEVPLTSLESKVFDTAFTALSLSTENSTNILFKTFFDKSDPTFVATGHSNLIDSMKKNPSNSGIEDSVYLAVLNSHNKKKTNIPRCEIITKNFVNVVSRKSEECVSYLYRNANKFMDIVDGVIKFKPELALIERTFRYIVDRSSSSRTRTVETYNITNSDFTFSADALLDTIRKLTGISIVSSQEPFTIYRTVCESKTVNSEKIRASIAQRIDEKFGQTIQQFYIDLPSIPYDEEEIRWATRKCDDLIFAAENIHSNSSNIEFNWNSFREAYRALKTASSNLAESRFESPELVSEVSKSETLFNSLCEVCGLDTRNISSLKEIEDSLFYYSNIDKIKFDFKPFLFSFNANVGLEMSYVIGKTEIFHDGKMKSIQNIASSFGGKTIIEDYFRPFFECFARTNKDSFKVEVFIEQSTVPNNTSLNVILKITFGCTEDLHECSKFRTFFYSIDNYDELINQARLKLGIPPNDPRKLALNEVPTSFSIRWARTTAQNEAFSGTEREKTYKFYDDVRGCSESYPFYDNVGPKIIRDDFKIVYDKYIQFKNRSKPVRTGVKPPGEDIDIIDYIPVTPVTGSIATERAFNFWQAKNSSGKDVNISSVINTTLTENKIAEENTKNKNTKVEKMSNPFSVFDDDYGKITPSKNTNENKNYDRRVHAQYRMKSKFNNSDKMNGGNDGSGWQEVKSRGKKIHGYKKYNNRSSTPNDRSSTPNDRTSTPNNRSSTPHRFQNKRQNKPINSTERQDKSSNIGTGNYRTPDNRFNNTFNNSRGSTPTINRNRSRGGTPGSEGRFEPYANGTSSPGFANKRAGGEIANSPSYLQPERISVFSKNSSSPSAQNGVNIFNNGISTPTNIPTVSGFLTPSSNGRTPDRSSISSPRSPREFTPTVKVVEQKFDATDEEW